MRQFNIVVKLLLPMLIGLVLIGSISIFSNLYNVEKNVELDTNQYFNNTAITLEYIIKKDVQLLKTLLVHIQKDEKLITLYKDKKRDQLYKYLQALYKNYEINHSITHFYIHTNDHYNFLRVHNKKVHSDYIDRETLKKSHQYLKTMSGVEFGISHNLTLRVVTPLIIEGKLIGFLELGKEMDKITEEYTELTNTDLIFTIKKSLITLEDFDKWKNKSHRNRSYHSMNRYYVIDSTIKNIDIELQKLIDQKEISENKYIENDGKKYYINGKDYKDINENTVGKIYVLKKVDLIYESLYESLIQTSIIILVIVLLIILYYFKHIKKIESELNKEYTHVQEQSIHDGLTGLLNKQYYLEQAQTLIQKCSRFNSYVSFIIIDIDNFKKYNDNYGHLKGDEVLKSIAHTIEDTFKRETDYCFRVGGEEFLIISASSDKKNGLTMAKKLCKNIQDEQIEHKYNENYGVITTSVGVYTKEIVYDLNIDEYYDNADKALYDSKQNGKNQVNKYKKA